MAMVPLIAEPRVPVIRGRDRELASVGEQLARLRSGSGSGTLVEGGAGMGKTRLLDEAAAIAARMSFKVGRGVADPGDAAIELAPLLGALADGPDGPFEPA